MLQRNRAASAPVYRHRQSVLGLRPSSHTKARTSPYPRNPDLNRYPVPEEKVTYIIVAARSCWRRLVSPSLSCYAPIFLVFTLTSVSPAQRQICILLVTSCDSSVAADPVGRRLPRIRPCRLHCRLSTGQACLGRSRLQVSSSIKQK